MYKFLANGSIADFQKFIGDVYGTTNDRLFSIWDVLINSERFTMRALKGIRKGDKKKLEQNLLIAFSWMVPNRLHIDLERELWRRFPNLCSYCGKKPCQCKKIKPKQRAKITRLSTQRPKTMREFQKMFAEIYPPDSRTLEQAGVHLAEEMGEVNEATASWIGEHKKKHFDNLRDEVADWVSCMFGVANSAGIDVAGGLAKIYNQNCHVCHKAPCECNFSFVVGYRS